MGTELVHATYVLDSWPVLEWTKRRDPAYSKFEDFLKVAYSRRAELPMCCINHGEVLYTLRKAPDVHDREAALLAYLALDIKLCSVDDELVDEAVELKSVYAFAFADAFAAALAIRLGVALVTGDRKFLPLERDGKLQLYWFGA